LSLIICARRGIDFVCFLQGDGDRDAHNRTVVRGEDRLFSTAVAVNTIFGASRLNSLLASHPFLLMLSC
jgi:hypothetical protein